MILVYHMFLFTFNSIVKITLKDHSTDCSVSPAFFVTVQLYCMFSSKQVDMNSRNTLLVLSPCDRVKTHSFRQMYIQKYRTFSLPISVG